MRLNRGESDVSIKSNFTPPRFGLQAESKWGIVTFRLTGWIAARLHSKRNCHECISRAGFLSISAPLSNFAAILCTRRTIDGL